MGVVGTGVGAGTGEGGGGEGGGGEDLTANDTVTFCCSTYVIAIE
jgi:hypothetical protein